MAAEIYHERYFFFNLPPMPGALKAMREMQQGEREAIVYVYVYVYVFVDVMYVSSSCPYHTYQIQSTNLIHFFPSSRLVSSRLLFFPSCVQRASRSWSAHLRSSPACSPQRKSLHGCLITSALSGWTALSSHAGKSKPKNEDLRRLLYILCKVECCITQLWCSFVSIILYNITS